MLGRAIETAELKTISAPLKARRTAIQDRLATDLHQAIEGGSSEEARVELPS
ncbi:hypothetical protein D3C72_405590 [compost metagenome]